MNQHTVYEFFQGGSRVFAITFLPASLDSCCGLVQLVSSRDKCYKRSQAKVIRQSSGMRV